MSDKEWYEGLTAEELEGKHVQVTLTDGTVMSGRLKISDDYPDEVLLSNALFLTDEDGHTDAFPLRIMWQVDGARWTPFSGITAISLVWDERDWEQIRTEDISEADAIVVNGHLWPVSSIPTRDGFLTKDGSAVPISFVSCALRRRHKLPIKPGAYRGIDGALLIRVATRNRNRWTYTSADFAESGSFDDEEVARRYLPLTPVHFVDGRAE